ncbi:MAG: c-type cytochrome [Sorangiineae bacterium]|nr:c-type cytochrome [Polyangiaceae bacterium]MEB2324461.1 c-type cytochrome [Sorangiineae bacterium]
MLSKSAARAFFLGGTALCSLAFIGLTWDTFRKIPAQTHSAAITESVARGKESWERNNCMGCHTLFGEGAYYAPELTKVYERRGPTFIRMMLKDPEGMYPGERKMTNYHLSDGEISDLVDFFEWCGKVDLNGFPAKPTLILPGNSQAATEAPQPEVFSQLCTACHSLGGSGGNVGPALDGVGSRYDAAYLTRWIKDPTSVKPGTAMPNLGLDDAQVAELVKFLSAKKTAKETAQ